MKERTRRQWRWDEATQRTVVVEKGIGKYTFTDEDRMSIVSDYIQGLMSSKEIVQKYGLSSRQVLLSWVDKFAKDEDLVSLPAKQTSDDMANLSLEDRLKELEAENKRLQRALELEKLRSKAYNTMIDGAEQTFNIPVRKKSGTKQ